MPGFEPQTGEIKHVTVMATPDAAVFTNGFVTNNLLLAVPAGVNETVELLSVTAFAVAYPTTAGVVVNHATGGVDTALNTSVAVGGSTAKTNVLIWRGSRIAIGGDSVRVDATLTTIGSVKGLGFTLEYRVNKHS